MIWLVVVLTIIASSAIVFSVLGWALASDSLDLVNHLQHTTQRLAHRIERLERMIGS